MTTLKLGSRGGEVRVLQSKLSLYPDGIFGPLTLEAVKDFQKVNGLSVDGIVGPKTWAALNAVETSVKVADDIFTLTGNPTTKRRINKIILHYTATPEGENYTVEQIRQMHLANGWSDIGYHWYVDAYGNIWKGRSEDYIGAHTVGQNSNSIGICYCGGCPPRSTPNWSLIGMDTRTAAQKEALLKLVKEELQKYPGSTVHGHFEFANKPCPGFDVQKEYENLTS